MRMKEVIGEGGRNRRMKVEKKRVQDDGGWTLCFYWAKSLFWAGAHTQRGVSAVAGSVGPVFYF